MEQAGGSALALENTNVAHPRTTAWKKTFTMSLWNLLSNMQKTSSRQKAPAEDRNWEKTMVTM